MKIYRRSIAFALAMTAMMFAAQAHAVPVAAIAALGVGSVTSFAAIAVTALVNIGLSVAFSALINKVAPSPGAQQRQASITNLALGEGPRVAVFGIMAVPGSLT